MTQRDQNEPCRAGDLTHAVTSRSFTGFISLLVINGSVSFLMEGNREEMVSCLHLSGICLNGRSCSLEIGHACVFSRKRSWLGWGWMSAVRMAERSQVFLCQVFPSPFPSPSSRPLARDTPCPAAGGWSEVVCSSQPK